MPYITLESIKTEQARLAELSAAFEAQPKDRLITLLKKEIELKGGEHYAGIILGKDGQASYHLILLPGEAKPINFANAKEWATSIGGKLPNRREQALLYANLKDEFNPNWYWSCEQYASGSSYAMVQHFKDGGHDHISENYELRARAVRRLEIL